MSEAAAIPSPIARPSFDRPERVSLWLCTVPLHGVPDAYLEGAPEVLAWLFVEFGIAVDGAFSTNYTVDREPSDLRELLLPLHGSEGFVDVACVEASQASIEGASFVIGLYDVAYEPEALGLPRPCGTPMLAFLGSYPYAP